MTPVIFEIGDRVELLPSAFDPGVYDPYTAWDSDDDEQPLSPGDLGTVRSRWGGGPVVEFDRHPGGHANVRYAHLRRIKLYGNEEEG